MVGVSNPAYVDSMPAVINSPRMKAKTQNIA